MSPIYRHFYCRHLISVRSCRVSVLECLFVLNGFGSGGASLCMMHSLLFRSPIRTISHYKIQRASTRFAGSLFFDFNPFNFRRHRRRRSPAQQCKIKKRQSDEDRTTAKFVKPLHK